MSASTSSPGPLERGREAYERHDWAVAYASLAAAEKVAPLGIEDLDRLAWSAELSGDSEGFLKATERVYEIRLAEGAVRPAARAAFWVGFRAMSLGEAGRANAWLARAQRLVEEEASECAEQGYLLLPAAFRHQLAGENDTAVAVAGQAAAIGDRMGDGDLSAFARTIQGRALVRLGQIERGMSLLDESMLAATANRLSPIFTGLIYCTVIASCQRIYAIERAREWTAALSAWFTAPSCCRSAAPGPRRWRRRAMPTAAFARTIGTRWPMRGTRRVRSTACGAPSRKPSAASRRPARTGRSRSRGWRCFGWPAGSERSRPA
jgi:hypothetical protein